MWQAPNQRAKIIAASKRREASRRQGPYSLKRVLGEVVTSINPGDPEITIPVRVILNDISLTGMGLFSSQQLTAGQAIRIRIDGPQPLSIQAKVSWCQEYAGSHHVITEQTFAYRAGVQFLFQTPEETENVKKIYDELHPKARQMAAAVPAQAQATSPQPQATATAPAAAEAPPAATDPAAKAA